MAQCEPQREHTLTFGLPTSAAFHGLQLFALGGVADPAGTYFGFALSQGLRITVCQ
ncbi:MAG: hypothetical protein NXI31_01610 [bacterium]|nr:hypothetical protein [bacterium]